MIPCPIEGCRQRCRSPDTLFVHIAMDHKKNDIVTALLKKTCQPVKP